jgi:rare lipoprotein A
VLRSDSLSATRIEARRTERGASPLTLLTLALFAVLAACARAPVREEPQAVPAQTPPPPPAAPETATVTVQKLPRQGNPPFYDVLGKRYHVMSSADGYRERGVASWYGSEFDGRMTASGEPYDMNALTAAHKTLPLPSVCRDTNVRNGRSVIVRVNDRGPFVRNRVIDLSYAAAEALDIAHEGTGIVDIEVLEPVDDSTPIDPALVTETVAGVVPDAPVPSEPPIESRSLYVQVGAVGDPFNAERMHQRLSSLGFGNVSVVPDIEKERPLYRVRLGPLDGVSDYDVLVDRLHAAAIDDVYLTLD